MKPPPKPIKIDIPDPYGIQNDGVLTSFPEPIEERPKIPALPKTIYETAKLSLSKPPKPIKPLPFQKVLNTIQMPMKIKIVPFKPTVSSTDRRPGKQPTQQSP